MELRAIVSTAIGRLGYDMLKPEQEAALLSFLGGRDVFVSLPTGYGKSLCYATLPAAFDSLRNTLSKSIVLVVSPLIALMKDQLADQVARMAPRFFSTIVGTRNLNPVTIARENLRCRLCHLTPSCHFVG